MGGGDRRRKKGDMRKEGRGGGVDLGMGDPRPDVVFAVSIRHLDATVQHVIFRVVSSCCSLANFRLEQTITISHSGYLR